LGQGAAELLLGITELAMLRAPLLLQLGLGRPVMGQWLSKKILALLQPL
jgi:hypothetical protein